MELFAVYKHQMLRERCHGIHALGAWIRQSILHATFRESSFLFFRRASSRVRGMRVFIRKCASYIPTLARSVAWRNVIHHPRHLRSSASPFCSTSASYDDDMATQRALRLSQVG